MTLIPKHISIGDSHMMKIKNGKIYSIGGNKYGALGNNSQNNSSKFVEV